MRPAYPSSSPSERPGRPQGFTLIELMVTVLILAAMAALLLPSPVERTAGHRGAAEAVREQFEFARAQAMATGLAHRVSVELESGDNLGTIRVFRGTSPQCQFNFGAEDLLVRTLLLQQDEDGESTIEVAPGNARLLTILTQASLASVQPAEALADDICLRPDGTARDARFNVPFLATASNEAAGSVAITINDNLILGANVSPMGPTFKVLVPYSGVARVAF